MMASPHKKKKPEPQSKEHLTYHVNQPQMNTNNYQHAQNQETGAHNYPSYYHSSEYQNRYSQQSTYPFDSLFSSQPYAMSQSHYTSGQHQPGLKVNIEPTPPSHTIHIHQKPITAEKDCDQSPPKWRITTYPLQDRLNEIDKIFGLYPLASQLLRIEAVLADKLMQLDYGTKVDHVYNPVDYAYKPHLEYYKKFCQPSAHVLLIGLNPGPFGMTQSGVPFGDVKTVSQWMRICEHVESPSKTHQKKPILGFDCKRAEVSGTRIWTFLRQNYGTPDRFFSKCFIYNYCPLSFVTPSGKNITPADLPAAIRKGLTLLCDEALAQSVVLFLNCTSMVGIGRFAQKRIEEICKTHNLNLKPTYLLHPSPQNPYANKHWFRDARVCFEQLGLLTPKKDCDDVKEEPLENLIAVKTEPGESLSSSLDNEFSFTQPVEAEKVKRNLFPT